MEISLISGTFSRIQGPSARIVAATIATAAFFALLIVYKDKKNTPIVAYWGDFY